MASVSEWTRLEGGFRSDSRELFCSVSGQPARQGEPIYRGPLIDFEGYFDICQDSARQVGRLAGLVDPDELGQTQAQLDEAISHTKTLAAENRALRDLTSAQAAFVHSDAKAEIERLQQELESARKYISELEDTVTGFLLTEDIEE